jgi:hypothetical protein
MPIEKQITKEFLEGRNSLKPILEGRDNTFSKPEKLPAWDTMKVGCKNWEILSGWGKDNYKLLSNLLSIEEGTEQEANRTVSLSS